MYWTLHNAKYHRKFLYNVKALYWLSLFFCLLVSSKVMRNVELKGWVWLWLNTVESNDKMTQCFDNSCLLIEQTNYSLRCFWCTCAFLTLIDFISVLFLIQCVFTRMSDTETIKKMLRSVLQSSKTGVSINSLQSEYRSLCGESIPLKKLGYSKLEDYLISIPSVVRLEYRMGEVRAAFISYLGLRPLSYQVTYSFCLTWCGRYIFASLYYLGQLASAQNRENSAQQI